MPQEPKKRHSRARQGKRRHSIKLTAATLATCSNCGNKHLSHSICSSCGFYNGKPSKDIPQTKEITKTSTSSA